jgi:hypothetical protein
LSVSDTSVLPTTGLNRLSSISCSIPAGQCRRGLAAAAGFAAVCTEAMADNLLT